MPPIGRLGFLGRTSESGRLNDLLARVRDGQSAALVIRGEPGIGKSALLRYAARQAAGLRVAQVEGVQAEMELPFAGIHRLCAPMLDRLELLAEPQRHALGVALGLASGAAPDQFLVGVAVLNLLAGVAEERPLLCLVDDAQWLDATSLGALGFVARRLGADAVAMIFTLREPATTRALDDLPEMSVGGLDEPDARVLLAQAVPGRLDERVRDRIIAETGGNPLALLELSQRLSPAERTGGLAPPAADLPSRLTEEYARRAAVLPETTRRLMLLAAAEPLGDARLLWKAADWASIDPEALAPASEAGLLDVDERVRFHHPLVRSAVYRAASPEERRHAHDALAAASDPTVDGESRAWHRALAAPEPDEAVAADLERSAELAQSRGGAVAAAAMLEQSSALTPDPTLQAVRALAAAEASFRAGDFVAAQRLLATAESGSLDDFERARAALVRGHVALVVSYGNEAATLLRDAAQQLAPFDLGLARRAYLTAWAAAVTAGPPGGAEVLLDVSRAILALPPLPPDPDPLELVIEGLAVMTTSGQAAAVPVLRRALGPVLRVPVEDLVRWGFMLPSVWLAIWHDESLRLYERQLAQVRDAGALAELPVQLQAVAMQRAWCGDLAGARQLNAEAESISTATGSRIPPFALLRILALEGSEPAASELIERVIGEAAEQGQGHAALVARWAAAVLYNGLARYEDAAAAAADVVSNALLPYLCTWAQLELVEAAARAGNTEAAHDALAALVATTQPAGTHLARGIEARCRALLADDAAEGLYREAIAELEPSGHRTELARAHLVYGEWLHAEGRLRESREPLRTAEDMFAEMGMDAFGARARSALVAAGAKPRVRAVGAHDELTPQEQQIARLASSGLTNPQIGAQLFLSSRTVEWHLHKVFGKLGIDSRAGLDGALPAQQRDSAMHND